jgi:hypothetical protein
MDIYNRGPGSEAQRSATLSSFTLGLSRVLTRDPGCFMEAVANTCMLEVSFPLLLPCWHA